MNRNFLSKFSVPLNAMIEYKKTIEYSENTYLPYCKNFDKYCFENYPDNEELTKEIALDWISAGNSEFGSIIKSRAGFIRGFGMYLSDIGSKAYILPNKFDGGKRNFNPYMFTDNELKLLFKEIYIIHFKDWYFLQSFV